MPDVSLVEMVVESVRVHMLSSRHVVILKETDRDRYLPIWIGQWEASAIAMKLQGLTPERPLTHDLFASALEAVGQVDRVVVVEMNEETYHARLILAVGDRIIEVDARPSDALALAVRTGARIYATVELMDQAGLGEGSPGLTDDPADGDHPLETLTGGVVDPRLDMFRDFVNSLDTDPGGESRTG